MYLKMSLVHNELAKVKKMCHCDICFKAVKTNN